MKKHLFILLLLFIPVNVIAEEEQEEGIITIRQGDKVIQVKESENPELANLAKKFKERVGQEEAKEATEEKPEQQPQPIQTQPQIEGSKSTADSAYQSGDFKTAYEHYKALSAQGDAEASMILAAMHSKGQGVEQDETAAHAWFTRAAEQGDPTAQEFLKHSKLSDEEEKQAKEHYQDIAKEFDEPEVAEKAPVTYQEIQRQSYLPKRPGTVDRTDQSALKAKSYSQAPARSYSREPAKSYREAPVKSYGSERFRLEKKY